MLLDYLAAFVEVECGGVGAFGQFIILFVECYVGAVASVEHFESRFFVESLDDAVGIVGSFFLDDGYCFVECRLVRVGAFGQ